MLGDSVSYHLCCGSRQEGFETGFEAFVFVLVPALKGHCPVSVLSGEFHCNFNKPLQSKCNGASNCLLNLEKTCKNNTCWGAPFRCDTRPVAQQQDQSLLPGLPAASQYLYHHPPALPAAKLVRAGLDAKDNHAAN